MALGTGSTFAMPDEGPAEAGSADLDHAAALWWLQTHMGRTGLEDFAAIPVTEAPEEPQMRVAPHLGATLSVADLPPDMRLS